MNLSVLFQSTPFKDWFQKSQIVDETGLPMLVYHGTGDSVTVLEPMRGAIFFTPNALLAAEFAQVRAESLEENAGYDERIYGKMESAGANIMPVFLSCQNPFDPRNEDQVERLVTYLDDAGQIDNREHCRWQISRGAYDALEDHYRDLQDLGFDGFFEKEDPSNPFWNIGVFHSHQVKSVFNLGTFNPAMKSVLQ